MHPIDACKLKRGNKIFLPLVDLAPPTLLSLGMLRPRRIDIPLLSIHLTYLPCFAEHSRGKMESSPYLRSDKRSNTSRAETFTFPSGRIVAGGEVISEVVLFFFLVFQVQLVERTVRRPHHY